MNRTMNCCRGATACIEQGVLSGSSQRRTAAMTKAVHKSVDILLVDDEQANLTRWKPCWKGWDRI